MLKKLFLFISIISVPLVAHSCPESSPAPDNVPMNQDEAFKYLFETYSKMDNLIPRIKPDDRRWYSDEIAAGGKRAKHASDSRIGVNWQVLNQTRAVLNTLNSIKSNSDDYTWVAYEWISLAKILRGNFQADVYFKAFKYGLVDPVDVGYKSNTVPLGDTAQKCRFQSDRAVDAAQHVLMVENFRKKR